MEETNMATQPSPDDQVLFEAKSTLEMLVNKMLQLQKRIERLEAAFEQVFGKGDGTVQ
jgi:hypothetical protein